MFNSQRYPLNLYLSNNKENIIRKTIEFEDVKKRLFESEYDVIFDIFDQIKVSRVP